MAEADGRKGTLHLPRGRRSQPGWKRCVVEYSTTPNAVLEEKLSTLILNILF
jgi:hypothetical protein